MDDYKFTHTSAFLIVLLLLSSLSISCGVFVFKADAEVFIKEDENNITYDTIQEAINNTDENNTIIVNNSLYEEKIIVNKSINIIGMNDSVIQGKNQVYTVYINSDDVLLKGLEIKNSKIAIFLSGCNNSIINNSFENNKNCIFLNKADHNNVSDNVFLENNEGVHLYNSSNNLIHDNTFISHSSKSIYLIHESNRNTISNNNISEEVSEEGTISLNRWSNYNNIVNNTLNEAGIKLDYCFKNEIIGNNISNTDKGVSLAYSSDNLISYNHLIKCKKAGLYLDNADDNNISSNKFTDNSADIDSESPAPNIKTRGFEFLVLLSAASFLFFLQKIRKKL